MAQFFSLLHASFTKGIPNLQTTLKTIDKAKDDREKIVANADALLTFAVTFQLGSTG